MLGESAASNAGGVICQRPSYFRNWNLRVCSFDDLLPAMRRLEDSVLANADLHSYSGLLPLYQLISDSLTPKEATFVQVASANGVALIDDFDGDAFWNRVN